MVLRLEGLEQGRQALRNAIDNQGVSATADGANLARPVRQKAPCY